METGYLKGFLRLEFILFCELSEVPIVYILYHLESLRILTLKLVLTLITEV